LKKKLYVFSLVSLFFIINVPSSHSKEVENKAVEINVKSINTNEDLKLSNFKNKYIFLDFWATWCEPCVKSMPHLEELQKKYSDKIKIISISDENEKTVRDFLNKNKYKFSIAIDIDKKTNKAYPHNSLPFILIIKPNRDILGAYYPEQLSIENVGKIISGDNKNIENNYSLVKENSDLDNKDIISYSSFSKGKQGGYSDMNIETENKSPYKLSLINMSVIEIYKNFYNQFSDNQIINEIKNKAYNEGNVYSFTVKMPKVESSNNWKDFFEKSLQHFNSQSGLKSQLVKKITKVKILKLSDKNKLVKNNSNNNSFKTKYSLDNGIYEAENIKFKYFNKFINNVSKTHIVDETNFKDSFNIKLNWRPNDIESFEKSLINQGFYFEEAEKEIEHLVISD
jgi:thiol-disulfide isomerase/thioredoxin